MKKYFTRRLTAFLLIVVTLAYLMIPVSAVSQADFSDNDCCVVHLDGSCRTAKVKFWIHDLLGTNQSAKVDVQMYDEYNNHIWSGTVTSSIFGTTLNLGNDHSTYYIYLSAHEEPIPSNASIFRKSIISGNNFTNRGKCVDWEFVPKSGCWIE